MPPMSPIAAPRRPSCCQHHFSGCYDKEEYDGIMETLHLLRSPANAARLLKSIAAADAGQIVERGLIEP